MPRIPEGAARTGRPRSGRIDRAVIASTIRLLRERGYQGLTMEGVAADAGVGKPAVYRRYRSKADLVADALLALAPTERPELPDEPGAALRALVEATAAALATTGSMTLIGSLLAQEQDDPELVATVRRRLFEPQQRHVRAVLESARSAGVVRRDAALQPVIDLLFGALLARGVLGERPTRRWLDGLLDVAWHGIAAPESRR